MSGPFRRRAPCQVSSSPSPLQIVSSAYPLHIQYSIGMRQWKKAQNILEQLKTKIGAEDYKEPQIQQEIQFIEAASLLEAQEINIEEAQERYFQALSCSFSLEWLSQKELPFIKREEGIIISNIANLYRKIGKQEEAEKLISSLKESEKEVAKIKPSF